VKQTGYMFDLWFSRSIQYSFKNLELNNERLHVVKFGVRQIFSNFFKHQSLVIKGCMPSNPGFDKSLKIFGLIIFLIP